MLRTFLLLLLRPIQKTVRTLLRIQLTAPFVWKHIHRLRQYFSTNLGEQQFVSKFDGNIKINITLSDHIEAQIFWQGVQEGDRGEIKLLKSLFSSSDTFLDIGGNVGVFSLIAAKRLTLGAVHAFEPSAYHLSKFKDNLLLNKYENIWIHPVALSNRSQLSKLYFPGAVPGVPKNTGMASRFPFDQPPSEVEDIECVRLDDYLQSISIPRVDIIKIDVEGSEIDVLLGAIKTIGGNRPHVVMEINLEHLSRAGRNAQEVIDYWNALRYCIYTIGHEAELKPIRSATDFAAHQNIYCNPCNTDSSSYLAKL